MLKEKSKQKNSYGVKHLAVIMDGNRRWAKTKNLQSIEGHKHGVDALKELVEICPNYDIKYLTVYAFSTENWRRPEPELNFLFRLLAEVAIKELNNLNKANVKVSFIGDIEAFKDPGLINGLNNLAQKTQDNDGLQLQIALNYGSVDEIQRACKKVQEKFNNDEIANLSIEDFSSYLDTKNCPDPELIIRTGGQSRLSNYLLWQAASAELFFLDTLWPDFNHNDLEKVLTSFSNQEKS